MRLTPTTGLTFLGFLSSLLLISPESQAGAQLSRLQKQHHYEIGYAKDGRMLVLKLVDTRTGHPIFTAYPHGGDNLKPIHHQDRLTRSEYLKLAKKLKRELKAQKPRPAAAAGDFREGLGLGYSNTAGYIGGQSVCYNFTTKMNGNQERTTFSSSQTASTLAGQFNLSTSIDLSFSFFKANNDFSYSTNYQNTANSGHLAYSAGSLYTANNVLVGLSDYGKQAYAYSGDFESQCGTDFISSLQVGMLILGDLSWSSTTSEANQKIEETLKASASFGNLSVAVSNSSSVKNSQSEFQFSLTILGGGNDVTLKMQDAYSSALDQRNNCLLNASTEACAKFTAVLEAAAIESIKTFDGKMQAQNLPMDLGFLEPFPNGVKGFPQATTLTHYPVANQLTELQIGEYLKPYQPAIQNALNLLSDLSILRNRAAYLYGKLYDPVTRTNTFNPSPMRDIANNDLGPLIPGYLGLRSELVSALQSCLSAKEKSVEADCKPVTDLKGFTTRTFLANRCLGAPTQNNCSRTEYENHIALQYVGLYSDPKGGYPLDFVYSDNIGSTWSDISLKRPEPGQALIGFVDSKYNYDQKTGLTDPWATILPFGPTKTTLYQATPPVLSPFFALSKSAWAPQTGFAPLTIESAGNCTFTGEGTPCPLNLGAYTPSSFDSNTVGRMTLSIFPLQDLFAR